MKASSSNNTPLLKSIKMFGNELVEIVFNDNVMVSVKELEQVFRLYDEVTGDAKVLKLLIAGKGTGISKSAREYITMENIRRKDFIIAEAIVVNSIAQKLSANIYISFMGSIYPTKFFTDVDKASEWLIENSKKIK